MRLSYLLFMTFLFGCSPKTTPVAFSNSSAPAPAFHQAETVYYFFEDGNWIAGTPDENPSTKDSPEFFRAMYITMKYPALARESGIQGTVILTVIQDETCLLYTSPSPRDATLSRMPSSA